MNSKLNIREKNNKRDELSPDSIEDMKAAFICVTKSLSQNLESPEDLTKGFLSF